MTESATTNVIPVFSSPGTAGLDALLDRAGTAGVVRDVAQADEMMLVFLQPRFDLDRATLEYFRSGANMARTIASLIDAVAPEPGQAVLDFGSGYGRVSRFLAARFGAQRLWASDVYAAGLTFQERHLGVHTQLSHTDPDRFPRQRKFRLIFSISVFTHLPAPAFHAWLRTLLALLEPGGVLAFTVHDEAVLNVGDTLPEAGILFLRQSESRSLSTEDYGSTWVNEAFLRRAAEQAAPGAQVLRLPRAICDYHDLILVAPAGSTLPAVAAIEIEPAFFLESCAIASSAEEGGAVTLRGWTFARSAAMAPAGAVARVTAELVHDGVALAKVASAPLARPDVPAVFPGAPLASGFACTLPLPPDRPHAGTQLLITIELENGARFLGYAAPLASALLDGQVRHMQFVEQEAHRENGRHVAREQHLERELAALHVEARRLSDRLREVETTLTWRVRRRLRRLLGLAETTAPH